MQGSELASRILNADLAKIWLRPTSARSSGSGGSTTTWCAPITLAGTGWGRRHRAGEETGIVDRDLARRQWRYCYLSPREGVMLNVAESAAICRWSARSRSPRPNNLNFGTRTPGDYGAACRGSGGYGRRLARFFETRSRAATSASITETLGEGSPDAGDGSRRIDDDCGACDHRFQAGPDEPIVLLAAWGACEEVRSAARSYAKVVLDASGIAAGSRHGVREAPAGGRP